MLENLETIDVILIILQFNNCSPTDILNAMVSRNSMIDAHFFTQSKMKTFCN